MFAVNITYSTERSVTPEEFVDVLRRSTLGERRPVHDLPSIKNMLRHANLVCTAWIGRKLVGVARSLTDFSFCCYLSDLAVDMEFQRQGIGKELVRLTQSRLGPECKIILLAAPKAVDYYPRIGFSAHNSAWVISARDCLKSR